MLILLALSVFFAFSTGERENLPTNKTRDIADGGLRQRPSSLYVPFPVQPQFCPNQEPRFLGKPCDESNPCFDYSLECVNKTCACGKNQMPSKPANGLCEPAPGLNQNCEEQCQIPLTCVDEIPLDESTTASTAGTAPTTPAAGSGAAPADFIMPPPPPNWPPRKGKTCQCKPPYILENGYNCRLNCKPGEKFDPISGACKTPCKSDEIELVDGQCAKIAKLGEACQDSRQCMAQFSSCQIEKCACQEGFDQSNGVCQAKSYSCPFVGPLQEGNVILCNSTTDSPGSSNCPDDSYCQIHSNSFLEFERAGHCCPRQNLSCPIGQELPDTSCGSMIIPLGAARENKPRRECPFDTHYCYTINLSNGESDGKCCPKACPNNYAAVNGMCYQPVQYGEPCTVDEQCRQFNGVCKDGKCQCPPNAKADGTQEYRYCTIHCGENEIQLNAKCQKRLKLGETCDVEKHNQCPINAGCDENKKCSCLCQYIQLTEDRCEQYPVCRKSSMYGFAGLANFGKGGAADMAGGQANQPSSPPPKPSTVTSGQGPVKPPPGNFTFCRIYDDVDPPVEAVRDCPKGQYCNGYTYDLGLCCPIPEPTCPSGSKGKGKCIPQKPNACPDGGYCNQYFSAVGVGSPRSGYTCCDG